MKSLVILADGAADYPLCELNNQTPLAFAKTPTIDRLAERSELGLVKTVPDGFPPGSDVANLSVLGYDPRLYYTGRSPLEAVSIGVNLNSTDVAFRCNLVTLSEQAEYGEKIMVDYSSDEITTEEAGELMKSIASACNSKSFSFYSGFSYRHLLVWHEGPLELELTPPHDISDKKIAPYLPKGSGSELLREAMQKSAGILTNHPVNQSRIARGLRPANSIWLWGQGKKPNISSFSLKYHVTGTVISAVDLIKGLGICAGLDTPHIDGATGNVQTNFHGKAMAALKAFKAGRDFVYLHVEAPDEAGHRGEIANKVLSIERIDQTLATILHELPDIDRDFQIMILPDHPTPLSLKTHTGEAVPFMIYRSFAEKPLDPKQTFNEATAVQSGLYLENGHQLMDRFIKGATIL